MLSAHVTLGSPGAGQRYAFLVLTNIAGVTCQVLGYPGMQLANAAGPIVTRVSRVAATPQLLTVTQGQHVYSQLHWTVVPATSETSNPCEPVPTVLHVTPPDETTTLSTSWPGGSVCQQGAIDVTPFKPGKAAGASLAGGPEAGPVRSSGFAADPAVVGDVTVGHDIAALAATGSPGPVRARPARARRRSG